jgi:predicted RNase H-like HicB family nuclease
MSGNLDRYVSLQYQVIIERSDDVEGYNAAIVELKGCVAHGQTVEEALENVQVIKVSWLEIALDKGWRIPMPSEPTPGGMR